MKLLRTYIGAIVVAVTTLIGIQNIQADTFVTNYLGGLLSAPGQSGTGCPGTFTASCRLTNSAGLIWIVPPTNTVTAVISTITYPAGVVAIRKKDLMSWCDVNNVTFPATNSSYGFPIYTYTSGITNGTPIAAQVVWRTVP